MNRNRLTIRVALVEVVTLEHASNRVMRRQPDQAGSIHWTPIQRRIEVDACRFFVEDLEDLRLRKSRRWP